MSATEVVGKTPAAGGASTKSAAGTVRELWRYPIKSMLGERVRELALSANGGLGDRSWALRDVQTGRIASAKKHPGLLQFRARYTTEPCREGPGQVEIEASDGHRFNADDADASETISRIIGKPLRLENRARSDEKTGIDPKTVFGDVPVSELKPEWTPETIPDYFQLMRDSFKEIGPVFVVTSGSIEHLTALQGGTALIDRRRFRPNIYIDSGEDAGQFVEDGWLGGILQLGAGVHLDDFQPTLWCVTSTLAQEELPRDISILRTAAQHHRGCLGVYASVSSPGVLRVGDPVDLHQKAGAPLAGADLT